MRAIRSIAVVGTAMAALALGIGSAVADPSPSGTVPAQTDLVAVGSDTTQFLSDQFSLDYNSGAAPTHTVPPDFYSWDAVNPTTGLPGDTIQVKSGSNITRPNGSGAGIAELQKNLKTGDGVHFQVDMARASRNIKSSDGAGIASVLIAKDLITYSSVTGSNAPANLSSTQLKAIYACDASILGTGHTGPVTWDEVGGTGTDQVVPVLPQTSSGTRSQWLTDIGETYTTTAPACVVNGTNSSGAAIEENEGTNAVFSGANSADIVFPFSGGSYVCQVFTKSCPDQHGSLNLDKIDNKNPLTSVNRINVSGLSAFGTAYIRGLYFVVRNAGTATAPAVPSYLQTFLGNGGTTGWICGSSAASDIAAFGFATTSSCGALTGQ